VSRIPRIFFAVLVACIVALPIGAFAQFSFEQPQPVPGKPKAQVQPQQKAPTEAQKHFANAIQLAKAGKADAAIAELQYVKRLMPKQPAVLINLGLCYMQKRDLGSAESAFRQALAIDPKNPFALGQVTRVLMMRGKSAEALTYAKKAASAFPKDPSTQFMLGVIYLQNKNVDAAVPIFKKVIALDPNNKGALYNLAYCQISLKQYSDARKTLDRFLKLVPDDPQAHMLAAMACEQSGDKAGAIAHLGKVAWSDSPAAHGAVMSLAQLYSSTGKTDDAIKVLKKALPKNKSDYDINLALGRILSSKQQYKDAEPYLLTAKQTRSDEFVNMALALNSAALNKLKEADIQAETAVKMAPKDRQALDVYAYVLDMEKQPEEVIKVMRDWEKYYPTDPTPNLKIAGKLQMQGKYDLASAEYQKAMNKKPGTVSMMLSAASCLRQAEKYDDAIKLLNKASTIERKNEAPLQLLGEIYEQQKKPDLAIAQYKSMLAINSANSNTLRRLANVYDSQKDYKNEIDTYRKLVKAEKGDVRTAMNIPRLYDQMGQLDTAITESKALVDANPNDSAARTQYGDLLAKKKDYDGALAQYAELIKSDDAATKGSGYFLSGGIQEAMGKTDDAIASYKKCIEAVPNHAKALDAIGKIYESKSQKDEFYAYLKSAIAAGKDNLPYGYYRDAMRKAGKPEDAVKTLEELAGKFPDSTPIGATLAQAYVDAGAKDKAVEQYKKVIDKTKTDSWTQAGLQRSLGDLYKDMGRLEETAQCYDASLKASGMFVNINLQKELGDTYVKLGKKAEALEAYKEYLKSVPMDEEVSGYVKDLEAGKLPTLKETTKPGEVKIESVPIEVKPETKAVAPADAVQPAK